MTCDIPPIPDTWIDRRLCFKERLFAKHSEIKEADEALSNNALASTDEPSGAVFNTQQVMSRTLDFSHAAALELTGKIS